MRSKTKKVWSAVLVFAVISYASLAFIGSMQVPPVYIVSTSTVIDATPEKVWDLLMATEDYPQWNPYLVQVDGTLAPGQQLSVTLVDANFPKPITVKPIVQAVDPVKEFYWSGTALISGIFDTRHFFKLEQWDKGTTTISQYEEFRGLLPMLLPNREKNMTNTRNAFDAMHEAMRLQLE